MSCSTYLLDEPDFNKIEQCWSWITSRIRKQLAQARLSTRCDGVCSARNVLTALAVAIATCNDVTALPSEFKRKGRFDENFFVDLPTASERGVILKIHLERFGCSVPDEYLEAIAAATEKFSGSELENLASEAATLAFDNGHPQQITLTELEATRAAITPLAIQDAAAVERMQEWARTARPASSPAVDTSGSQSLRTPKLRAL